MKHRQKKPAKLILKQKKPTRVGFFVESLPAYLARLITKPANSLVSASLSLGCGGIGTAPPAPLPPLDILVLSLATASASPLYLLATSCHAGPTIFLSIA